MSNTPSRRQPDSYTVWERLEPVTRDYDLTGSLRAEIRDPAWLLARQWQTGEFQGNDGGSPVAVDLEYVQETLDTLDFDGTNAVDYEESSPPIEPLVERERVLTDRDDEPNHRIRVEAGLNFLSRLHDELEDRRQDPELPDPAAFPESFHLDMNDDHLDDAARRFQRIAGGTRSLDGYTVYCTLDDQVSGIGADNSQSPDWSSADRSELPRPSSASGSLSPAFKAAAEAFYTWYADLYAEPNQDTGRAWNEDRLLYEFDATTSAGTASTTFAVDEYDGQRLDWDDFSVTGAATGNPDTESPDKPPTPTRLMFKGMPRPRYWELEDADVDLSALSAAPEDLSWLTMVEIALTAGNKWFLLPLTAEYGSLTRITNFEVADTFHEGDVETASDTTTVEAAAPARNSGQSGAREADWNAFLFEMPGRTDPGLWLPPVLGSSLESDPVERVRFARDETANLVFAIENLVEGALGGPLDRGEFDRANLEVSEIKAATSPDDEYIKLRNAGDDDLSIGGWKLQVEVVQGEGQFDFNGDSLSAGGFRDIYTFSDITIDAESTIRLYTGGTPKHDTDDELHIGAQRPLWGRGTKLKTYGITRPDPTDTDHETVLANPVGAVTSSLPQYRLATDVPAHWFPMRPKPTGTNDYRLELALLMDAETLEDTVHAFPEPMGQILTQEVSVYDEVVTEAGTEVERTYGLTLDTEGYAHCWSGRTVSVGSGEASSGLRFDILDESTATGEGE